MKLFSLILAVISLTSFSEAHPGGLDANGGHYNRKTGEYHYHRKRARPITKTAGTTGLAKDEPAIHPAV